METGAVIAAAGLSSRMGTFKPLMEIGGETMARRVVSAFRQIGAEEIVVVTGHNADVLEAHLADLGPVCLRNRDYARSQMFDSLRLGLSRLRGRCRRVFITPVDVPLFTADTLRRLLDTPGELVCPVYRGRRGHPLLLDGTLVPFLLSDTGEGGLRGALARWDGPVTEVEVPDPAILRDADTPSDAAALQALLEEREDRRKEPSCGSPSGGSNFR